MTGAVLAVGAKRQRCGRSRRRGRATPSGSRSRGSGPTSCGRSTGRAARARRPALWHGTTRPRCRPGRGRAHRTPARRPRAREWSGQHREDPDGVEARLPCVGEDEERRQSHRQVDHGEQPGEDPQGGEALRGRGWEQPGVDASPPRGHGDTWQEARTSFPERRLPLRSGNDIVQLVDDLDRGRLRAHPTCHLGAERIGPAGANRLCDERFRDQWVVGASDRRQRQPVDRPAWSMPTTVRKWSRRGATPAYMG